MLENIILKVVAGYFIIFIGGSITKSSIFEFFLQILIASFIMWHITYTPAFDWEILKTPYTPSILKVNAMVFLLWAGLYTIPDYKVDKDNMAAFLVLVSIGIALMFLT